jgi:dolichyl-phosphate beta-glucosyltransferase
VRKQVEYSVVIPAYNEALRLPETLRRVDEWFAARTKAYEFIVVDDGSADETLARAKGFRPRQGRMRVLRNLRNRGKGASVRRGVAAACGRWILFTDADLSTPIEELEHLQSALGQGEGVAIGSRAVPGAQVVQPQPWYRTCMGKTFNLCVRLLLLPGVHDTQCGFKLFSRSAARRLFRLLTIPRFGFDVELLYLARRSGLTIREVPVAWYNSAASRVSPIRDSCIMFIDLFRIRWRYPPRSS